MRINRKFSPISIDIETEEEKKLLITMLQKYVISEEDRYFRWNKPFGEDFSFAKDLLKGLK